ncbi:MAG: hypothetical protein J5858_16015 [Lentisphaeria bacterium]|nr:hypothetical protein [Lentisphaeria bacterium]
MEEEIGEKITGKQVIFIRGFRINPTGPLHICYKIKIYPPPTAEIHF